MISRGKPDVYPSFRADDVVGKERGQEGLQPRPAPNRNPNDGGPGMAENSLYYDSARADNQENSNWQSLGDLARRLAEKQGGAE